MTKLMDANSQVKATYVAPKTQKIGAFEQVTLANVKGNSTDVPKGTHGPNVFS